MGNLSIQFGFAACPKNMSLAEGGQMLKYRDYAHYPGERRLETSGRRARHAISSKWARPALALVWFRKFV